LNGFSRVKTKRGLGKDEILKKEEGEGEIV
jgi:hypothetical protein